MSQLLIRVDDLLKSILDLIGGGSALDEFKRGVEAPLTSIALVLIVLIIVAATR